jgi:hypothetical protein
MYKINENEQSTRAANIIAEILKAFSELVAVDLLPLLKKKNMESQKGSK